jgi:hypothetical protein
VVLAVAEQVGKAQRDQRGLLTQAVAVAVAEPAQDCLVLEEQAAPVS